MDCSFIIYAFLSLLCALLFVYMHYESYKIRVVKLDLYFENLPQSFEDLKILQISDLHIKKYGKLEKHLKDLIQVNPVDICVVTGDIAKNLAAVDVFHDICKSINVPVYAVLGNTEHKPWADTSALVKSLSAGGTKLLVNSSECITRNGDTIYFVGVDDPYYKLHDLELAFNGINPDEFIIFLTHCPSVAPEAIEKGADILLAGHTHGGQVRIPGVKYFWTHMRKNKQFGDGLFEGNQIYSSNNSSVLYVNRGVGTSRLHIRLFCPPEITSITLKKYKINK